MAEVSKDLIKSPNEEKKDKYPSNAFQVNTKPQQPKKKKKPIDRDPELEETEKKQPIGSKIAKRFMDIDRDDIKNHLLYDWLFPEIIDMVSNLLTQLFLGNGFNGGSPRKNKNGHTAYDKRFKDRDKKSDYGVVIDDNFKHIRIQFSSRGKAIEVQDSLREDLEDSECGYVTVKELFNHPNISATTNYKMNDWVWYDLEDMDIVMTHGDYILEMPPAGTRNRRQ